MKSRLIFDTHPQSDVAFSRNRIHNIKWTGGCIPIDRIRKLFEAIEAGTGKGYDTTLMFYQSRSVGDEDSEMACRYSEPIFFVEFYDVDGNRLLADKTVAISAFDYGNKGHKVYGKIAEFSLAETDIFTCGGSMSDQGVLSDNHYYEKFVAQDRVTELLKA